MKFESNFLKKASKNLKDSVNTVKKSLDNSVSKSLGGNNVSSTVSSKVSSLRKSVKEKKDKVMGAVEKSVNKAKTNIGNQLAGLQNQVYGLQNSIDKSQKRVSLAQRLKGDDADVNSEQIETEITDITNIAEITEVIETVEKNDSKAENAPEILEINEIKELEDNLADDLIIEDEDEIEKSIIEDKIEIEQLPAEPQKNIFKSALEAFRRGRNKNLNENNSNNKKSIFDDEDLDIDVPPAIPESKLNIESPSEDMFMVEKPLDDFIPQPQISTYPHTKLPSITPSMSNSVKSLPNTPLSSPVYVDYASLTPIDPRVKKVMFEAMDLYPANPSSLYKKGVEAKKALEDARMSLASFFGANKNEIIFTSGGTESNNLVFRGILKAFEDHGSTLENDKVVEKKIKNGERIAQARPHIIVSTIEHPSIIEIALDLISQGIDVSFIPVNEQGLIDPRDIKKALRPETILISIIYANNEIGTVQPLKEIAREVRHFKKSIGRDNLGYPYIHTDACQAALYEDMRVNTLNIDLMTVDGGKVYGPRGIGALVKKRHVKISAQLLGGSQENGLRAGTENLPSIIGLKHALDLAHSEREEQSARLLEFRETLLEMLMSKLQDKIPGMKVNGTLEERLPNNLNICFPGIDAEFLVLRLDVLGVELSSVTSCRATNEDASSYVIEALGRPDCALSSLRISLGRFTTTMDIGNIAEKVCEAVLEQKGKDK